MKIVGVLILLFGHVSLVFAQTAADAYYDPQEMAASRAALKSGHGAQMTALLMAERFELRANDGDTDLALDAFAWFGSDEHKFWLELEGDYASDESQWEEFELQALYSRGIGRFWDLQVGVRQDIRPKPSRSYAVLGLHGVARYWFEVDAAIFLSDEGDVSARIETEYELRLTQRLILQPRIELNAAMSDDPAIGVASGLGNLDVGLRLRYEVRREVAPYIGLSWDRAFGDTADLRRLRGAATNEMAFVAGLRLWF